MVGSMRGGGGGRGVGSLSGCWGSSLRLLCVGALGVAMSFSVLPSDVDRLDALDSVAGDALLERYSYSGSVISYHFQLFS